VFYFYGIYIARIFIVLRQAIISASALMKTGKVERLISLLGIKPAQLMVASFVMTILIGAFLLTLPVATRQAQGVDFVDALFTATSATCVTGLTVVDTGSVFSLFGQLVILFLIQVGGLGIMTFSVTLFMSVGHKISHREALAMQEVLDHDSITGILGLVWFIARMTLGLELLGALVLFLGFKPHIADPLWCAYAAVFHSVSAFCNAGFSLFRDNLVGFRTDALVNLCISFLIIMGGLGFIVIKDIWEKYGLRSRPAGIGLKLHTKMVLAITAGLLVFGTLGILAGEYHATLQGLPLGDKLLISFFQSVTARTAGFNTVDIGSMANPGIFCVMVLMFIGASSGSTGGGVKTTTFGIVLKALINNLQNKDGISMFKRRIPDAVAQKAVAVFILSLGLVIVFTYVIGFFEQFALRDILFETISAFGTVGLSTGITGSLHIGGKLLITLLMLLGRLGPLTFMLAFARQQRKAQYVFAEEKVMVG